MKKNLDTKNSIQSHATALVAAACVLCAPIAAYSAATVTLKANDASAIDVRATASAVVISIDQLAITEEKGLLAAKATKTIANGKVIYTLSVGEKERATVTTEPDGKGVKISIRPVATPKPKTPATGGDGKPPAEDGGNTEDAEFTVDTSIPASPAFMLLGVNPSEIVSPTTPRALAMALTDGRDKDGKLKSGIAIDFAPLKLGSRATLVERDSWDRDGTRLKLSFATVQGKEAADDSRKVALGVNWLLFDSSVQDKRDAYKKCSQQETSRAKPLVGRSLGEALSARTRKSDDPDYEKAACERTLKKMAYAENAFAIGAGQTWLTETGKWGDRLPGASGFWATYGTNVGYFENLEKSLQLTLHARRMRGEFVANPIAANAATQKEVKRDSEIVAAKLKFGQTDGNIGLEHTISKQKFSFGSERVKRTALQFEWRPNKKSDIAIVASGGSVSGRIYGENKPFVLTQLRFGGHDFTPTP